MSTTTAPPSKPGLTNTDSEPFDKTRMSFGDHLEELRSCLIKSLVGVLVATAGTLYLGKDILELICRPLLKVQYANGLAPHLQVLAPMSAFTAYLKIGLISGLIVSAPWVLYQVWSFIAIGLYEHERKFVRRLIPASGLLFAAGVMFLYVIVLPLVLHFFITFNRAFDIPNLTPSAFQRLILPEADADPKEYKASSSEAGLPTVPVVKADPKEPAPGAMWYNEVDRRFKIMGTGGVSSISMERSDRASTMQSQFAIEYYISFVLMLALGFGIAFETPIVVFFLAWTGLVPRLTMARGRRYVLLGIVIAAALLTPPDIISQVLLAGPMYLLFELGLLIARLVERRSASAGAG